MLDRLRVKNFKSIHDQVIEFPKLTVLFGANAAGKSNILDAIQALSRIGTQRTLADALGDPIRGRPIEAFMFPSGGLPELLTGQPTPFSLEAKLSVDKVNYIYRIDVGIAPQSGVLSVSDEYLTQIGINDDPKGLPSIQQMSGKLRIRRKSNPGKPRNENLGQNYAILSDPRLGRPEYQHLEKVRTELSDWRTYYLDPRISMRSAQPPSEVRDIGVLGGDIAPFLFRLQADAPKAFDAAKRTLRSIIPSVEDLSVDLDKRRGELDILIRQSGIDYSSRIVSEGTLRVLALCAVAVNPWGGSLLAFEEPENGVHPRRIELIAQLLCSLADQKRQVVITTHSPLFCDAVLRVARSRPGQVGLFSVGRIDNETVVRNFHESGPLFSDTEISDALLSGAEDGLFENLMLRGLLDG